MPTAPATLLHPRKTPIQARSAASVDAILQATIQVLVAVGKERLTTTRVAQRAGVSVGTLYQYFPNKSALLQACLKRHMNEIIETVEQACQQHQSAPILEMASALIAAFLSAKMRQPKASAALYSVSSDIDGVAIAKAAGERIRRAVTQLFSTAREALDKDPETVAAVVLGAINGITRRVLESRSPDRQMETLRPELLTLVHAYLQTCAHPPAPDAKPAIPS